MKAYPASGLLLLTLLLLLAMAASVMLGVTNYPMNSVWNALTQFEGSQEQLIIRTARIPRALIAAAAGGGLAVAGLLMQAVTRNPLASPSLFGINAGAVFLLALCTLQLGASGYAASAWIAFLGAVLSAGIVYLFGSIGRDGLTPVKITLAGASITALFHSLTQGLLLSDGSMFDQILVWLVGSVAGRELGVLQAVLPFLGSGLLIALLLSRHLNVLALGDSLAAGLGQRTVRVKLLASAAVALLAGAAVACAGPIAFVGIIVPHIVRYFVGPDYRWAVPYNAVGGALLLVAADLVSRYLAMPREVPVGVTTAILGVPVFIWVARKGVGQRHA